MADTPNPATDTGSARLPDPALGEVALAHAVLRSGSPSEVHPTEADLLAFRNEQTARNRRMRRTDRQLAFLYALLVLAFALLAYRSMNTDNKIQSGLYDACLARVQTTQQFNANREALVQFVLSAPNTPKDPDKQAAFAKQLRDGLLLPIEDCGAPPS